MSIITSTEFCALDMEHNRKKMKQKLLRQYVNNILRKNLNQKIKSNLTKDERRALRELQKNDKLRVHELNKGCGSKIAIDDTAKEINRRTTRQSKNRPSK